MILPSVISLFLTMIAYQAIIHLLQLDLLQLLPFFFYETASRYFFASSISAALGYFQVPIEIFANYQEHKSLKLCYLVDTME